MTPFFKYHLYSFLLVLLITTGLYEFIITSDVYFFVISVVSVCGLILIDEKVKRADHV